MSSNITPPPRKQLCTRSCSNKHTHPLLPGTGYQQPTASGPIPSQLRLTQQLTAHWPQFKALHQRYAGTRFEEQRMLHMPQKHKSTVQDSTLRMEMNALESKLTTTKPASSIGSPSHDLGPSGPQQPMMIGISCCGRRLSAQHWVWRCQYSTPSPATTNACPPCEAVRGTGWTFSATTRPPAPHTEWARSR